MIEHKKADKHFIMFTTNFSRWLKKVGSLITQGTVFSLNNKSCYNHAPMLEFQVVVSNIL